MRVQCSWMRFMFLKKERGSHLFAIWRHNEKSRIWKRALSQSCWHAVLRLWDSKTVRNKFLFFISWPVYMVPRLRQYQTTWMNHNYHHLPLGFFLDFIINSVIIKSCICIRYMQKDVLLYVSLYACASIYVEQIWGSRTDGPKICIF